MVKKFSTDSNNKQGFSLLELLVVISIMAILVSIGTVAFITVQRTGRDSRRRADLRSMQDAFEQYIADNGTYADCSTMVDYDSGSGALIPAGLPVDPRNSGDYVYNTSDGCDATGYCICALLEGSGGNANEPTGTACDYSSDGEYFCVSQRQ